MKLTIAIFLIAAATLHQVQAACTYSTEASRLVVGWTAFKTPKKAPAKGQFKQVTLGKPATGESIEAILKEMSVSIDANVFDTGDKIRDGKIAKFFFSTMLSGQSIQAKVLSVEKGNLVLELDMNGKKHTVPMTYTYADKKFRAEGSIDVAHYGLEGSLQKLNKECSALHEKKLWPDVLISVEALFDEKC